MDTKAKILTNLDLNLTYKQKQSLKTIFVSVMLFLTFTIFLTMLLISYQPKYANIDINDLSRYPIWLRIFRSMFPVFMTWYIFFSVWSINTGLGFYKRGYKWFGVSLIFGFLIIFSLINLIYLLRQINRPIFYYYYLKLFAIDPQLDSYYARGKWRWNISLISLIIILLAVVFIFVSNDHVFDYQEDYVRNIWFNSFNYFTIQTNSLIILFSIVLVARPGLKIFKNNNLQLTLIVYIFVVGVTWNLLLLPPKFIYGDYKFMTPYMWISTIWFHIINPITFITINMILVFKHPFKTTGSYRNVLWICMPYVFMYMVFIAIVPFTAGVSIYGLLTNTNPHLLITSSAGTRPGSYAFFALEVGFIIFFFLLISGLWSLDHFVNTKRIVQFSNNFFIQIE